MRILIATGIYPPQIGGPAYYAKSIREAFEAKGHTVAIVTYAIERSLPIGIRHFFYFLKIMPKVLLSDFIIALDTFSVGLPAMLAARLLGKKVIIRVGGDFLWESYVARTNAKITLPQFYLRARRSADGGGRAQAGEKKPPHSLKSPTATFSRDRDKKLQMDLKECLIFKATRYIVQGAHAVAFSTEWQRTIWIEAYTIDKSKTHIIENYYGPKESSLPAEKKVFLWAGRDIALKNVSLLKEAFARVKENNPDIGLEAGQFPRGELMEKIKRCYAVVLPSLSDVSPNIILEAIQHGKPFIATQETGLYEKLEDIGLFVDPLDVDDLTEKIVFLADEKNYAEYKRRVESFEFTHSWEEIADEFLQIRKHLTFDI